MAAAEPSRDTSGCRAPGGAPGAGGRLAPPADGPGGAADGAGAAAVPAAAVSPAPERPGAAEQLLRGETEGSWRRGRSGELGAGWFRRALLTGKGRTSREAGGGCSCWREELRGHGPTPPRCWGWGCCSALLGVRENRRKAAILQRDGSGEGS